MKKAVIVLLVLVALATIMTEHQNNVEAINCRGYFQGDCKTTCAPGEEDMGKQACPEGYRCCTPPKMRARHV